MTTTALVPLSAKPIHHGHYTVMTQASRSCDRVIVFVSRCDRLRRGEFPITGQTMVEIWKRHIEPTLPENVSVEYVSSPVGSVYALLETECARLSAGSTVSSYVIFGGVDDINVNFPDERLTRYVGPLFCEHLVSKRCMVRSHHSGMKMRGYLQVNDERKFKDSLPDILDDDVKSAIWTAFA